MKTTIEIDEGRLKRVMKMTGIRTRREAVNTALADMEHKARVDAVLANPIRYDDGPAFDPQYDLLKMREMEKPRYGKKGSW